MSYGLKELPRKGSTFSEHDYEIIKIIDMAFSLANQAVKDYIIKYGHPGEDGQAWVTIKPISSKLGQILLLKYNGIKEDRCVKIFNPGVVQQSTKLVVAQEGAYAYASILIEHLDAKIAVFSEPTMVLE